MYICQFLAVLKVAPGPQCIEHLEATVREYPERLFTVKHTSNS